MRKILKCNLTKYDVRIDFDYYFQGQGPAAGFCEHGNDIYDSVNGGDIFGKLSHYDVHS
jgi:hypothetical protein